MTIDEAKEALEDLKKEGNSDEDILKILYAMYQDDNITLSDLRSFTELLEYEFTEEFEAMSEEDKKTKGVEIIDDQSEEDGDMSLEDLKEAVDQLREDGESEEDILKVLYLMYTKDEFGIDMLRDIVGLLGYEFTDEFEAMSEHDKKTKGWRRNDQPQDKM